MTNTDLIERLKSSAKAFRENTVYDSEGDPLRLIVQADECDEAAAALTEANAKMEKMRAELDMAAFRMQLMVDRMPPDEDGKSTKALCQTYVDEASATLAELEDGR